LVLRDEGFRVEFFWDACLLVFLFAGRRFATSIFPLFACFVAFEALRTTFAELAGCLLVGLESSFRPFCSLIGISALQRL
jgi:hypothetical protein